MKAWVAFFKKEWTESVRTGRLLTLGILFSAFGIMNPAIAKLTPLLFELLADELAEGGMIVTAVEVNALTSWTQFFKNLPVALIVFLLMFGGCLTKEYESGTLVLLLTKGLHRANVVLAKAMHMLLMWTVGFWLCFGITYVYNDIYWDNGITVHLMAAAICWWLFGVLTIAALTLFSTIASSSVGVLLGVGGMVLVSYAIGFLPACRDHVPTALGAGMALADGTATPVDYTGAIISAAVLSIGSVIGSIPLMNKKQI